MKITSKTTAQEIIKFLGSKASVVKATNKDLYDRMLYTDKMVKTDKSKVTKKDLVDLANEVIKSLEENPILDLPLEQPVQVVAENSVKKSLKKAKTEEPKVVEKAPSADKAVPSKEDNAKVEKSAKKTTAKKAEKESGVTVLETGNEKTVQLAKMFKETFELEDNTYTIAHDIKTMEDLYTAMENEETIVIAMYWTKRHLRQFDYYNGQLEAPKEFPLDLDLCTCIYVSEEFKVAYNVSMYTEANYMILPEDLEEIDGIRSAGGIEFQIYRQS